MQNTQYRELFFFAAKAGALEGYLFEREKVEPLENWVNNISSLYQALPVPLKREIASVLTPVLKRTLDYGKKTLEAGLREKLEKLLAASAEEEKGK